MSEEVPHDEVAAVEGEVSKVEADVTLERAVVRVGSRVKIKEDGYYDGMEGEVVRIIGSGKPVVKITRGPEDEIGREAQIDSIDRLTVIAKTARVADLSAGTRIKLPDGLRATMSDQIPGTLPDQTKVIHLDDGRVWFIANGEEVEVLEDDTVVKDSSTIVPPPPASPEKLEGINKVGHEEGATSGLQEMNGAEAIVDVPAVVDHSREPIVEVVEGEIVDVQVKDDPTKIGHGYEDVIDVDAIVEHDVEEKKPPEELPVAPFMDWTGLAEAMRAHEDARAKADKSEKVEGVSVPEAPPTIPDIEAPVDYMFELGQTVRVRRQNGALEDNWQVGRYSPLTDEVYVERPDNDVKGGKVWTWVSRKELGKLNYTSDGGYVLGENVARPVKTESTKTPEQRREEDRLRGEAEDDRIRRISENANPHQRFTTGEHVRVRLNQDGQVHDDFVIESYDARRDAYRVVAPHPTRPNWTIYKDVPRAELLEFNTRAESNDDQNDEDDTIRGDGFTMRSSPGQRRGRASQHDDVVDPTERSGSDSSSETSHDPNHFSEEEVEALAREREKDERTWQERLRQFVGEYAEGWKIAADEKRFTQLRRDEEGLAIQLEQKEKELVDVRDHHEKILAAHKRVEGQMRSGDRSRMAKERRQAEDDIRKKEGERDRVSANLEHAASSRAAFENALKDEAESMVERIENRLEGPERLTRGLVARRDRIDREVLEHAALGRTLQERINTLAREQAETVSEVERDTLRFRLREANQGIAGLNARIVGLRDERGKIEARIIDLERRAGVWRAKRDEVARVANIEVVDLRASRRPPVAVRSKRASVGSTSEVRDTTTDRQTKSDVSALRREAPFVLGLDAMLMDKDDFVVQWNRFNGSTLPIRQHETPDIFEGMTDTSQLLGDLRDALRRYFDDRGVREQDIEQALKVFDQWVEYAK